MDSKLLIQWYQQNQRDLPWRHTVDPYRVWLSEVILQQTRVAQGLPYYLAFTSKYPSIYDLASANEQEILKLWQGLGYYSRARNLHHTAKMIVAKYHGIFPDNYKELLTLKGIGAYTAAAIASFCYNEPVAVVDGNVYRVLSRLFGIDVPINTPDGQKIIKSLATESIDAQQPGTYNQAIMEFGALHCTPSAPSCSNCPFNTQCVAHLTGKEGVLPIKLKKIKIKKRDLHYFLIQNNKNIILEKREGNGIWQNLYQLPLIEQQYIDKKALSSLQEKYKLGTDTKPIKLSKVVHKLTHQHLNITFWQLKTSIKTANTININQIKEYPMPIVIANFLDNNL